MKTIKSSVVLLLLLISFPSFSAQKDEIKIGYIDKEALLVQMPEIIKVNDSIMKAQSSYQQQYQLYEQELAQKTEYLTKNRETMSNNMLMLKAKEIDDLKQYMQYLMQIDKEDMVI